MKTLLKNAKILTLNNKQIFDGEILVEGNKIAQIAKKINTRADRVIDCEGNLLMPGFNNAHTHSGMVFVRGIAEGASLETWLNKYVLPLETQLRKNDIYHLTKFAYLECLESGITSVFDMYFSADEIINAATDIGMRATILLTPRNIDLRKINSLKLINGLITPALGFHALYSTSKKDLMYIKNLSKKLKAPVYTHCCETVSEVNSFKKKFNLTPIEYLNKFGIFDYGGGIFHGVHLSKNDFKILKNKKIGVCSCPTSNLKLASGIAPIKKFLDNNINVALGTDGAGSNNSFDMIKEMGLLALLSKYRENNPASLESIEVLKTATINGSHFMQLKNVGVIKKGNLADIIMVDLHAPNMLPIHNIVNNLIYSANKGNIMMTMIDGKILYYKHKFYLKEDIKRIYQKANLVIKHLTKKVRVKN